MARINVLPEAAWSREQHALMAPMVERDTANNLFRTLVRHPPAFRGFLGWASHVLSKANALPPRLRELAILRTASRGRCAYVWSQHVAIARRAGLGDAEIAAIGGRGNLAWSEVDRIILAACDAMHEAQTLGDALWSQIAELFEEPARMDLVFTIAQYSQLALIANAFAIERDTGLDDVPLPWTDQMLQPPQT